MNFPKTEKQIDFELSISGAVARRFETGKPISMQEFESMKLNSYEKKLLLPLLDKEALILYVKYCKRMSTNKIGKYSIPKSYEHFLATDAIDLLLAKLEE